MYILIIITSIIITTTLIIFAKTPMDVISALPLYISLFVMFLQAKVNRYTFILGGLNSVFYAAIYFSFKLYGMAAYALLVSFPLQIITFIRWNKNSYEKATVFKSFGLKKSLFIVASVAAVWVICYIVLSFFDSSYLILDNTVTILSILSCIICMLSYVEHVFLTLFCSLLLAILYLNLLIDNPAQSTYFIFNLYSITCSVVSAKNTLRLYRKQQAEKLN